MPPAGAVDGRAAGWAAASLIERFFRCSDRMVLPYDDFWGSSGVMLQALDYGLPVLVASRGLVGWQVGTASLGATYMAGEYEDLRARFERVLKAALSLD